MLYNNIELNNNAMYIHYLYTLEIIIVVNVFRIYNKLLLLTLLLYSAAAGK